MDEFWNSPDDGDEYELYHYELAVDYERLGSDPQLPDWKEYADGNL